jgi:hypothetical protein
MSTYDTTKIEAIIKWYKCWRNENPDKWIIDCKNSNSLEIAIRLAATGRNLKGQKHGHQNLIPPVKLDIFASCIIKKLDQVAQVRNFDELIAIIESCRVKGVGELAVYDTANRIGNYIGIFPDKIYLHRGTRAGAKLLLGGIKSKYITKEQLPIPLQTSDLSNAELEDILCFIQKFSKINS